MLKFLLEMLKEDVIINSMLFMMYGQDLFSCRPLKIVKTSLIDFLLCKSPTKVETKKLIELKVV